MEVRAATPEDVPDIVEVHRAAFPGFFLTRMGRGFVAGYYDAVLSFREGLALVALKDGRLIGFVVGFGNPGGFYNHYRRQRRKLLPFVVDAVAKDPTLLPRILSNLHRVSHVATDASEVELASLGVHPAAAGRGVGRALVRAFLAAARGYRAVYLSTDAEKNDAVNRFYAKAGFARASEFRSGARRMVLYRLELSGLDGPQEGARG